MEQHERSAAGEGAREAGEADGAARAGGRKIAIDPETRLRQREWSELYQNTSLDQNDVKDPYPAEGGLLGEVTDKYKLVGVWFTDAIHARAIDYPRTDMELLYMSIGRSQALRILFNVAVAVQIIASFFQPTYCDNFLRTDSYVLVFSTVLPAYVAIAFVDLTCLAVYALDLFLAFRVNYLRKSLIRKPWSTFRLLCCVLLFLSPMLAFGGLTQLQLYVRCVFPFFLISRRNNLKLMLQGLFKSVYHAMPVIKALICVIFLWGFVGYVVFRTLEGVYTQPHFDTPWDAIYTALHCFTSRPYILIAMSNLWDVSPACALWFTTLTLASDILCINLIIGVGSRQYKIFAQNVLRLRLRDRRIAVCTVFQALAIDGKLYQADWLRLCAAISDRKYRVSSDLAAVLFAIQDQNGVGYIDLDNFFQLSALVASRVKMLQPGRPVSLAVPIAGSPTDSKKGPHEGYAANLVDRKVDAQPFPATTSITAVESPLRHHHQRVFVPEASPAADMVHSGVAADEPERYTMQFSVNGGPLRGASVTSWSAAALSSWGAGEFWESIPQAARLVLRMNVELDYEMPIWLVEVYAVVSDRFSNTVSQRKRAAANGNQWRFSTRIFLFETLMLLFHFLLVLQLGYISGPNASIGWIRFGWALEFFFILEMVLKLVAGGPKAYWRNLLNRTDAVINLASFIALVIAGSTTFASETPDSILAVLLIQSLRFFRLFFFINDMSIFEHILPILGRATFIYASFIYFFAIFAHGFYCALESQRYLISDDADDNAPVWSSDHSELYKLLNFNTLIGSCFTLFQMSILGKWSIVMDAAAEVIGHEAYFFFYAFRLITTLFVLPILISFILQSFISAVSKKQNILDAEAVAAAAAYAAENSRMSDDDKHEEDSADATPFVSLSDIAQNSANKMKSDAVPDDAFTRTDSGNSSQVGLELRPGSQPSRTSRSSANPQSPMGNKLGRFLPIRTIRLTFDTGDERGFVVRGSRKVSSMTTLWEDGGTVAAPSTSSSSARGANLGGNITVSTPNRMVVSVLGDSSHEGTGPEREGNDLQRQLREALKLLEAEKTRNAELAAQLRAQVPPRQGSGLEGAQ